MSISDGQYRAAIAVAGAALVAGMFAARFCGNVSSRALLELPDKPPPPAQRGASGDLAARAATSIEAYEALVAGDASAAGIRAPTLDELGRKLPYRVDDAHHVLEVGEAIELAGLRLRALRGDDGLALEITNTTGADLAYDVATAPIGAASCDTAQPRSFNAMTIARDHSETRTECRWRDGISLAVTRVETLELPPLAVWYVNHVPPAVVGIEPRIARAHRAEASDPCRLTVPQAVRSGLERREIGWRDLIDFYARHRCQTYRFPIGYRAFRSDGERGLPVIPAGM